MTGATCLPDGPLVAWYGDDYTGAAAVMEVLQFAGLPAVLFLDPPTPAQLARFPDARGIGIAGTARAQGPDWMDRHLPGAFDALIALGAPVVHYKVCSTFDSAPHIGSIGRATEIGLARTGADWAPLLTAAPEIGRYQAFGTLFAASGNGVHRLDRHPVMARHPVTPMDEADLGRHLARQTDLDIGLVPLDALASDRGADAALARARGEGGARIVSIDTVDAATLRAAGRLIWRGAGGGTPVFAVGSQGVEYALVAHWQATGAIGDAPRMDPVGAVDRLVVVSGSASPVNDAQIACAEQAGFSGIRLDPCPILSDALAQRRWIAAAAEAAVAAGPFPILYTARGPDDPAIPAFRNAAQNAGLDLDAANARLGAALGDVLAAILDKTGATRAVIAGGDTSSYAAQQLGIFALTARTPLVPGGALCMAHRDGEAPPLEIMLKGGQMGPEDIFDRVRTGRGTN